MLTITGRYDRTWTNSAKKNLVRQVPLIAAGFAEIADYYPATINVRLRPMLVVAGSDHRTPPLNWKAGGEDGEVFDLVRLRATIGDRPPVRGLLYVGHWSLHRLDPHKHEFVAEQFIVGLTDGDPVTIEIDRSFVELPYTKVETDGGAIREARTIVVL